MIEEKINIKRSVSIEKKVSKKDLTERNERHREVDKYDKFDRDRK